MPQADITIIGTAHVHQIPGEQHADALEQLIMSYPRTASCSAIVEELSSDTLSDYKVAESVGMRVAHKLALCHRLCDPDAATRDSGNMLVLRMLRLKNDLAPLRDRVPDKELERQAEEAWHRRENYWLDRIVELNRFPILFICGAWHVPTFAAKARGRGLSVEIAEADWPDGASVPSQPWLA